MTIVESTMVEPPIVCIYNHTARSLGEAKLLSDKNSSSNHMQPGEQWQTSEHFHRPTGHDYNPDMWLHVWTPCRHISPGPCLCLRDNYARCQDLRFSSRNYKRRAASLRCSPSKGNSIISGNYNCTPISDLDSWGWVQSKSVLTCSDLTAGSWETARSG